MAGPSPEPALAVTPPPRPAERVMIVDEENMFRVWLEEKVAGHELTSLEADKMLDEQEG